MLPRRQLHTPPRQAIDEDDDVRQERKVRHGELVRLKMSVLTVICIGVIVVDISRLSPRLVYEPYHVLIAASSKFVVDTPAWPLVAKAAISKAGRPRRLTRLPSLL